MTEVQAFEAMLETWKAGWDVLHPSDCPFTFDNEVFNGVPQWARVTIVPSVRIQGTLGPVGSRRWESRGRIAVQLFVDVDQGSKPLSQLADDVRAVLEGKSITVSGENIALFAGSTNKPETDGRWFMCVVDVPYFYQEKR